MAQLVRRTDSGWLGGVCSGIAARTGIDVNIVRVVTAVGLLVSFGTVAILYVVLWAVLPKA